MPHAKQSFYNAENYTRDESVGWLLRKLKQSIVQQADLQLHHVGLTHAQWAPLINLRLCGPRSTVALGRELGTDAGALTRLLDRLEAKNLVKRERCNDDRRVVTVSLSEEGRRITAELPAVLADVYNAHLKGFSEQEWRLLLNLLQRMIDNGEALRGAGPAATPQGE
ncbi:MarR family winged helix-turn-helix transcriptional regulator [Roseateles koreensis]|uniref:MarR family winged helix-turn-helix transcriptional regulator n=1 Tax=Roseateles koreensis TaxID=2987526 RepID=A0ABT5KQS8_9BURK|nr:MarR family winged helix-turn-helix transcriptional regulator [Roseateles koreensis]MDC8785267.1 MarR family winged helix-turn-helix transcriptional regulator [Roseateles koreensis]